MSRCCYSIIETAVMIHILVIDDNPGDVLMIREAIRNYRLPVDTVVAYDGEKAVEILNSGWRPDVIVLDLNLPRRNGFEVLERWKAANRPPVIVFTSFANLLDETRALNLGVRECLVKPSGVIEYLKAIGSALERWIPAPSV